jgi:hypothetical protein
MKTITIIGIVGLLFLVVGSAEYSVYKDDQKIPVIQKNAVNDTLIFIGNSTFISTSMRDTLIFIGDDTFVESFDDTFVASVASSSAQPQPFISWSWKKQLAFAFIAVGGVVLIVFALLVLQKFYD